MIDIALFRSSFPEFADDVKYTDSQINYWGALAECTTSKPRFECAYDNVIFLYIAHSLALAQKNILQSGFGGVPGGDSGAISSKAVGSASVSFDSTASSEGDAGHWNQTIYGRQYIRLLRLFSQGCYQIDSSLVSL